nr:RNA-directed DNA polymerase, eukaryota, reverse transcriptase zinc-binding domain protein [Tanacetum cinerariifolium]
MKCNHKIPHNLDDFVHSINTLKTKKKNKSTNSGIDEVNLSVNSNGNRDNMENSSDGKMVDDKCNRSIKEGGEERNDRDGFVRNLNGEQFPSISKMAGNKNVRRKDNMECLDKEGNFGGTGNINNDVGVETVVIGDESDNNNKDEVNADTEKSKDNKLISVPTQTSETGNGMVIFDDEIIELGNEEGIKKVIKNGPWMVYNKPMVVQKWNIDICFDKAEPKKMPIWVKLLNVPMEAWSVKGINALASSLGKPIIMDEVTTKICVTGVGRISFARVLVEIDARKGIKDKIEIMYQSKNVAEVEKINVDNTETMKSNGNEFKVVQNKKVRRMDYNMYRRTNMQKGQYGRMWREMRYGNENNRNSKFEYRVRDDGIRKKSMNNNNGKYIEANGRNTTNEQASGGNIKRNENSMNNGKERNEGSTSGGISPREGVRIVDEFLSKQGNVNNKEMNGWNEDMKRYYRDKKELLDATRMIEKNEDVMGMNDGEGNDVLRNEVEGKGAYVAVLIKKQEVKKLIEEEKLSFCAILETHVKYKNIKRLMRKLLGIGNILLMVKIITKSNGSANPSSEMIDFQECVNNNRIVDLHSKGFYYTWTKSLENLKCRILKKLDRVMVNEAFMDIFQDVYGVFLPYMNSDHYPIIVKILNGVQKKKKGVRGLRQGDPISPYLFTLVMEVFNLIVRKNIKENENFKYHYRCKKLEITHLCFADDLLVFCHGDCESVSIIKKYLNEFNRYSGLRPNMQKITVFFRGLSNAEQNYILQIIPFTVGKLDVSAAVYYIWQERNCRMFKNEIKDSNTILQTVKKIVGMKLSGMEVKESSTVREVEERWNVKMRRS